MLLVFPSGFGPDLGGDLRQPLQGPFTLYEDFDSGTGVYPRYDTYDISQRQALSTQKHADIRSFEGTPVTAAYSMYALDQAVTIATLDTETMLDIETGSTIRAGEAWTAGVVGVQVDRNNFQGLALSCTAGTNVTSSVIHTPTGIATVDLSAFGSTHEIALPLLLASSRVDDYLSLTLPAFPAASINKATSFIDFTSEPSGDFTIGPTDSLPFSVSTTALSATDCEARFPVSLLTNVDRSQITGVRFRIAATANCVFRCLAIRCMAATWQYAPIDQNTLYERVGATVPPSGALAQATTFPRAAPPITPADWPVLFFSDNASGLRHVNAEIGTQFRTGSNGAQNTLAFYLRETQQRVTNMSMLDSTLVSQIGVVPDPVPGRLNDFYETYYLKVTLSWGINGGSVTIGDQSGTSYAFATTFTTHTDYYLQIALEDHSLRVQIYHVDSSGLVDWTRILFDSTAIVDDTFIPRRKGRCGWYAQLGDGDAYLTHIRPRHILYNEFRSLPLASYTPVDGARVYVSSTSDRELLTFIGAARRGTSVTSDVAKSSSGRAVRVECDGGLPLQGIITRPMRFEDFNHATISFDVFAPVSTELQALLYSAADNTLISLYLPPFKTNRWTRMRIPLGRLARDFEPGSYAFMLLQTFTTSNTWYIDNLSVQARSLSWEGRGDSGDAWRMSDPEWIEFAENINDPHNAALLGRGKSLQVRAQGLTADAAITDLKVLPKYAELGRFVWPEDAPVPGIFSEFPGADSGMMGQFDNGAMWQFDRNPMGTLKGVSVQGLAAPLPASRIIRPAFGMRASGHQIICDGSTSDATNGVAAYQWQFGDGVIGYGPLANHTYRSDGEYLVRLTVIDRLGVKESLYAPLTLGRSVISDFLHFAGDLARAIGKRLTSTLNLAGGLLTRLIHAKAFTGTVSFIGSLAGLHGRGLAAVSSFTGKIVRAIKAARGSTAGFSGNLNRVVASHQGSVMQPFSQFIHRGASSFAMMIPLRPRGNTTKQLGTSRTAAVNLYGNLATVKKP